MGISNKLYEAVSHFYYLKTYWGISYRTILLLIMRRIMNILFYTVDGLCTYTVKRHTQLAILFEIFNKLYQVISC